MFVTGREYKSAQTVVYYVIKNKIEYLSLAEKRKRKSVYTVAYCAWNNNLECLSLAKKKKAHRL